MNKSLLILLLFCSATTYGQSPASGSLCDDVAPVSSEDFWLKWNAADYVLVGLPVFAEPYPVGSNSTSWITAAEQPLPVTTEFILFANKMWKGPAESPPLNVTTAWGYSTFYCGNDLPAGYCLYGAESCALTADNFVEQVFFLREIDGQWQTYTSFGTGTYDQAWLEAEVGAPVAISKSSWGYLKSLYNE